MTLLALIIALVLEQLRPIRQMNLVQGWVEDKLLEVRGALDPERRRAIWFTWAFIVGGAAIGSMVVSALLGLIHPLLELLFAVAVLYLTLGFRQFSHWFSDIHAALKNEDLPEARRILGQWVEESQADAVARSAAETGNESAVVRESIRLALVAAQRHVFGPIFWFVVLPGPSGALAYWLNVQLLRAWGRPIAQRTSASAPRALLESEVSPAASVSDHFSEVACRAYSWLDWLPVRVTAIIFAIVGNFEDSIAMWRSRAGVSPAMSLDDTDRVLVASGAGAIGVRLTVPDAQSAGSDPDDWEGQSGLSAEPDLREATEYSMKSSVGLVWRAVIMWFFIVLIFYLGRWLS
jgi:adenosylcobinamide-phosphate synthase